MGRRKNQNRGRGKKKKTKNSSRIKSTSNKESSPQQISQNADLEKKQPIYKSGNFWDILGIIIAIIAFYFSEISTTEIIDKSNKNRDTIVDTLKKSTDTVLISLNIINQSIELLKKNYEETKSLLKPPVSREEYEKDKDLQRREMEAFKNSTKKYYDTKIDSIKREIQNSIVKGIAYVNSPQWLELFNLGYSLFRIDVDKKLYTITVNSNPDLYINWSNARLMNITNESITLLGPDINDSISKSVFKDTKFPIYRNYSDINLFQLREIFYTPGFYLYAGIISDNKNGIVGILGFSKEGLSLDKKPIIEFDKFQQITQIDFEDNPHN